MTAADFRAWRKRLGLTQAAAAEALGLSLSRIGDYEKGSTRNTNATPAPIPKVVALACAYLELTKGSEHE